jgi:hypothetical protein
MSNCNKTPPYINTLLCIESDPRTGLILKMVLFCASFLVSSLDSGFIALVRVEVLALWGCFTAS